MYVPELDVRCAAGRSSRNTLGRSSRNYYTLACDLI